MAILGDRIKYLRGKKGLSQKRLAAVLGITNVQLSRYETSDRNPDPEMITKIANALETSVDFLLGRSNSRDVGEKTSILQDIDAGLSEEEIFKKHDLIKKITAMDPNEEEIKAMLGLLKMMRDE